MLLHSLIIVAYNWPYKYSSNTGFEEDEKDLLYFVVDASGQTSFVHAHDKPGNSDGKF